MARRVDVLNCKPEDLFLAVSLVEQQLAQKSLMTIGGRKKIPFQVFSIMSEHIIPDTNSGWRLFAPPELGTTLLSCTKAHWEDYGILPEYLPTSSRFSYTLPDVDEMFMNGVLIDVHSQKWKAYVSDLLAFPLPLIEPAQQIIKDTIDAVIHQNNPPQSGKGSFWGVEYFQRIKILLQNMMFLNRDNIREWLAQAMQKVISGPADFQAAKVAILTLVSMNERAWSRAYGEDERDLMIEYCEVQLDVIQLPQHH